MDTKEKIFISFSSKDKEIADGIYNFLKERWKNEKPEIFYSNETMDHFSSDFIEECFTKCRGATLGIIILSNNSKKSPSVQQEIGCLIGCNVERFYIALNKSVNQPMGLELKHQTFPYYRILDTKDPNIGYQKIAKHIEEKIFKRSLSRNFQLRQEFQQKFMEGKYSHSAPFRNQCAILQSLKCAEEKIKIMGENSLQPIHGGFEILEKFLNGGGSLDVLLVDYDSEEHKRREEIEDAKITRRLRADWLSTVSNLFQLNKVKKGGTIEVKYTPQKQIGSLLIIDDWHLQYNQYKELLLNKGKREHHSSVLFFVNQSDGSEDFKNYNSFFDQRWNDPTSKILDLGNYDLMSVIPEKIFIN